MDAHRRMTADQRQLEIMLNQKYGNDNGKNYQGQYTGR